jgi:hypothetical protein
MVGYSCILPTVADQTSLRSYAQVAGCSDRTFIFRDVA